MAELGLVDELNDEQRSELDTIEKGTADLERQLRAAQVAVEQEEAEQRDAAQTDAPDAETRERIELRGKASLGNYLVAAARGRMVDGAEAELQSAAWGDSRPPGVSAAAIPLEIFDLPRPAEQRDAETRAITEAPGTVGVNLDPIRPAIFANSIAPRLGIQMPRSRERHLRDRHDYHVARRDGARQERAGRRNRRGNHRIHVDPEARFRPPGTGARGYRGRGASELRVDAAENLSLALSDELDNQAINGNGTAPNLAGIFQRLTDPSNPAANVEDFDRFVAIFAGGIDGLWANTVKDIGIVVAGVDTYVLATKTFRDRDDRHWPAGRCVAWRRCPSADYAMAHMYGGFWTNKRMPATANHIQQGILYRKGRSGDGGQRRHANGRVPPLG